MRKPILKRLTEQLIKKGVINAPQVARDHLTKCGHLIPGTTRMTPHGIERTNMGAKGRAIDRASQRSGRPLSDYIYSSKLNRARLK